MNGFAGLRPAKEWRRGASVLRKLSRSSKAECAGPVVGPAALTVESGVPCGQGGQLPLFRYTKRKNNL